MANANIVQFEEMDLEGDNKPTGVPEKLAAHLKFLKEKLSPEDYAAATKELGVKTDLSNEELLTAIKALLTPKEQDGEEDTEEDKTKMASYKDFMAKCMKDGKDLKTCAEEYKKQYPKAEEPSKEEAAEVEALAKKKPEDENYPSPEYKKKMEEMETKLTGFQKTITDLETRLTQEKNTAALTGKVDELIKEKHLAPSQKEGIIKMASGLAPEAQEELLTFFRTTQKLSGLFTDAGKAGGTAPGKGPKDFTPEYRAELTKKFHIDDIVEDRGVKPLRRNN